jgi:hypothetical protein
MHVDTAILPEEKLQRMKRFFLQVNFEFDALYSSFFPKLNEFFVSVLCEVYKVIIFVFDNNFGDIFMYKNERQKLLPHICLFKVGESEYFGVLNIDECVEFKY